MHLAGEHRAVLTRPAFPLSPQGRQNRLRLLSRVQTIWIRGVLEQSLHQTALISLNLEEWPDVLATSWHPQVQETNLRPRPLPAKTSIIQVYNEANGELLLLGEPGAGKTILLLQLAQALLPRAREQEQDRLPVIFNLASWAQKRLPLTKWLVEELQNKYKVQPKVGRVLIEQDQVLPLLDGLDEVAQDVRVDCVRAINTYQQQRMEQGEAPLVVCCRSQDYLSLPIPVALNQAISIQPLTDKQIEDYLQHIGGKFEALRQGESELQKLVRTPLMLSVLAQTYRDRSATDLIEIGSLEEIWAAISSRCCIAGDLLPNIRCNKLFSAWHG